MKGCLQIPETRSCPDGERWLEFLHNRMARMTPSQLRSEVFSGLAEPFTGEELFDQLPDLVFFVKNLRGEYVVVNKTLTTRCGLREKSDLLGRRADELFPAPLGESYRQQDETVILQGKNIVDQLELHFYPSRGRGWCLTSKFPLLDRKGGVIGLVGISKDLQTANDRGDDYPAVAKAVGHMKEHLGDPLRVADLAGIAGLSPYQFEQRVIRIFHLTVSQLLQKTRMEAALGKLRDTDDPISRIALDCGYSDQSAFTRKFRQTTGVSPSAFRASCR